MVTSVRIYCEILILLLEALHCAGLMTKIAFAARQTDSAENFAQTAPVSSGEEGFDVQLCHIRKVVSNAALWHNIDEVTVVAAIYDLALRKEVLMEKAADIAGDIMRYIKRKDIDINDDNNPVMQLFFLTYRAKEDILTAPDEGELKKIEGKLEFANSLFLKMCQDHD